MSQMSGRGVIFTDESVRAILDGRKTQTRRVVDMGHVEFIGGRGQENDPSCWGYGFGDGKWAVLARGLDERFKNGCWSIPCPYGEIGAQLWVKETWRTWERPVDAVDGIRFRADDAFVRIENTMAAAERWVVAHDNNKHRDAWRPSIFLPRWASRITLRVTEVRVQRVQEISEPDAKAEGVIPYTTNTLRMVDPNAQGPQYRPAYEDLWSEINGAKAPWSSNRWVWAVTFERVV
jgi:hypothetical protein